MSPRLMSISSSSVSVTDIGACAISRSPSQVDDALDRARAAGRQHRDGVADADGARRDLPGVAAELMVRADDELHREAERLAGRVAVDLDGLEELEQALAPRTTACDRSAVMTLSPCSALIGIGCELAPAQQVLEVVARCRRRRCGRSRRDPSC